MKNLLYIIYSGLIVLLISCSKDLGNYDYSAAEIPKVSDFDSVYPVYVGDMLHIDPTVTFRDTTLLSYEWKIFVPEEMKYIYYTGRKLDIFFGLGAKDYSARLSIIDNTNGMNYFHYCTIKGKTDFSQGIVLLTSNEGQAELSFIKPNGEIQTDLYGQMHGEPLPGSPRQLIAMRYESLSDKPYLGYWVICSDPRKGGVQLDVNTLKHIKFLNENFFNTPEEDINTQYLFPVSTGVMNGIINNKFYMGASSTFYLSPVYGYFGLPAAGDYEVSPHFIVRKDYCIGFDINESGLVYFDGGGNFQGNNYQVQGNAFNPLKIGIDVLSMMSISSDVNYCFGKNPADQQIYELKFSVKTNPRTITPIHKKAFKEQSLVDENTLWALTNTEIIYFSHKDKIYRYNPLNGEIKTLNADFNGKDITLLKLKDDNTLIAGTEGYLCYLDISTGQNGNIINDINNIIGSPIDLYEKNN